MVIQCASAALARAWAAALARCGFAVLELHSHKSAEYRSQALEVFRLRPGSSSSGSSAGSSRGDGSSGGGGSSGQASWPGLVLLTAGGVLRGVDLPGLTLCVGLGLPRDASQLAEQLSLLQPSQGPMSQPRHSHAHHVLLLCEHEAPGLAALQTAASASQHVTAGVSQPSQRTAAAPVTMPQQVLQPLRPVRHAPTPAQDTSSSLVSSSSGTQNIHVQWVGLKPDSWPWANDGLQAVHVNSNSSPARPVVPTAAAATASTTPGPQSDAQPRGSSSPTARGRLLHPHTGSHHGRPPAFSTTPTNPGVWARVPLNLRANAWISVLGAYLTHPLLQATISAPAWTRVGAAALELLDLPGPPTLPHQVAVAWGPARCAALGCGADGIGGTRTVGRSGSSRGGGRSDGSGSSGSSSSGMGGRSDSSKTHGGGSGGSTRGSGSSGSTLRAGSSGSRKGSSSSSSGRQAGGGARAGARSSQGQ